MEEVKLVRNIKNQVPGPSGVHALDGGVDERDAQEGVRTKGRWRNNHSGRSSETGSVRFFHHVNPHKVLYNLEIGC